MDNDKEYINNSMAIGTGLFELYLALQSIAKYEKMFIRLIYHYLFFCRMGEELFDGAETSRETFEVSEKLQMFGPSH